MTVGACGLGLFFLGNRHHFQYRFQVVLHTEFSENGRLLGQVANAQPCPFVHWLAGDVSLIEVDAASIGFDEDLFDKIDSLDSVLKIMRSDDNFT